MCKLTYMYTFILQHAHHLRDVLVRFRFGLGAFELALSGAGASSSSSSPTPPPPLRLLLPLLLPVMPPLLERQQHAIAFKLACVVVSF